MTKPAPFKRPSVDLGRHGRSWQRVSVESLKKGDIVAEHGELTRKTACDEGFYLTFFGGKFGLFEPDAVVYAFIRKVSIDD